MRAFSIEGERFSGRPFDTFCIPASLMELEDDEIELVSGGDASYDGPSWNTNDFLQDVFVAVGSAAAGTAAALWWTGPAVGGSTTVAVSVGVGVAAATQHLGNFVWDSAEAGAEYLGEVIADYSQQWVNDLIFNIEFQDLNATWIMDYNVPSGSVTITDMNSGGGGGQGGDNSSWD